MTSEEIKNTPEYNRTPAGWLKEVAYQLALLVEAKPKTGLDAPPARRKA